VFPGADPGFQVRGGGALKKIASIGGRREKFCVKNHDFTPKNHIFTNFRGGGCNMDFSKWLLEILHEIEYLVFHNYFVFFGKQFFFLPKFTFSGPISFRY
jgi:hypothetical protein